MLTKNRALRIRFVPIPYSQGSGDIQLIPRPLLKIIANLRPKKVPQCVIELK